MGYAFPMFYGDLLLYPFALIELVVKSLGIEDYWIMGFYFSVMGIASIIQFRYFMQKIYDKDAVKFAQLIYVTMPYFQYFVLRQAAGEAVAQVLYPAIFYGFSKILNMKNNEKFSWTGYWVLTAQVQLLILNHLISAYIVCFTLLIWTIYRYKKIVRPGSLKTILASAVTTLGICSYFLIPLIEQLSKGYLVINNTVNDLYNPVQLGIGNLFLPSWFFKIIEVVTGFRSDIIQAKDFSPAYFGFMLVIVGVILWKSKSKDFKKYMIMTIGLLLICTPAVRLTQVLFEKIQFPFRFLEILSFIVLVFILKNWEKVSEANIKQIVSVQLLGVALIALESNFVYADYANINGEIDIQTQIGTGCEYLPYSEEYTESGVVSFKDKYDFDRWASDISESEAADIDTQIINGGYLVTGIQNKISNTDQILLPINYYLGYSAFDESGNQYKINMGKYGLIEVTDINDSVSSLRIIYAGTNIQRISYVISILAVLIFIQTLVVKYFIKNKKKVKIKL